MKTNGYFPNQLKAFLFNFRANNVIINIDQNASLISIHWNSQTDSEDIKNGYQVATELANKFKIKKWLHDTRNIAYVTIENQNWICKKLVPQLMNSGIAKAARIIPDEPLAMLISGNIIDKIHQNPATQDKLKCEIFTDYNDALYWLNS